MKCPQCGTESSAAAKFCGICGRKLEVEAASSVESVGEYAQSADSTVAMHHDGPSSNIATARGFSPVESAPASAAQAHSRGCLGAAWHDITSSDGWVKRVLLLMLMKCVPILGFYVSGYNLQWGAEAARGNMAPLPKGTFGKHTFLMGLFYALLTTLLFVANTAFFAVNFIPFIGFILLFVLNLFAAAFCMLAAMRMTMFDSLGEAFELSKIFKAYKSKVGGLFAAACVPSIVTGAIFWVVTIFVVMVMTFAAMTGASSLSSSAADMSMLAYDPFGAIMAIVSVLGGVFFVLVVLYFFLAGFAEVWSMRAVGHWVARFAPDWVFEASDETDAAKDRHSA